MSASAQLNLSSFERFTAWKESPLAAIGRPMGFTNHQIITCLETQTPWVISRSQAVLDIIATLKTSPVAPALEIYRFLLWDVTENGCNESGIELDDPRITQGMVLGSLSTMLGCFEAAGYRTRQEAVEYIRQWILSTQNLPLEIKMLLLDYDAQVVAVATAVGINEESVLTLTEEDLIDLNKPIPERDFDFKAQSLEMIIEQFHLMSKRPSGTWEKAELFEGMFAIYRNQLWQHIDRDGPDAVLERLDSFRRESGITSVIDRFLTEVNHVRTLKTPHINWMQAYAVYWMLNHDKGINISSPGTGKTWTVPLIAMALNAHITVVIAPKSTFADENSQIEREIARIETEGEYAVHKYYVRNNYGKLVKKLPLAKRNYILTNPEQFQLSTDQVVQTIIGLNPDLLVMDEFQFFMSKDDDEVTQKRLDRMIYLLQHLPKTKKYFMSATPYRTNVAEPVSALKYILNDELARLRGRESRSMGLKLRTEFLKCGFRFLTSDDGMPKLHFKVLPYVVPNEIALQIIDPTCLTLQKECLLASTRAAMLKEVTLDNVPINPVHYSTWVDAQNVHPSDGPVDTIQKFLGGNAQYCLGTQNEFPLWKKRKGALIASWPFATGLDGAQDISDTLFIWATPPTGTGLQQLISRIFRPPSKKSGRTSPTYEDVYVYYPLALNVPYDVDRYKRLLKRDDFLRLVQDGPAFRPIYKTDAQIDAHLADLQREIDTQYQRHKASLLSKFGVVPEAPVKILAPIRVSRTKKFQQARGILAQFHSYVARLGGDRTKQAIDDGLILNGVRVTEPMIAELERKWSGDLTKYRPPQSRIIEEVIVPFPNKRAIILGSGSSVLPDEALPHDITLLDFFIDHPRILKRNMTNTGLLDASYDTLVSVLSLYKKDAAETVAEMARIAAPGAEVWIVKAYTNTLDPWYMTNIPTLLETNGFVPHPANQDGFVFDIWDREFKVFRGVKPK
jgi:hypothetical protein